MRPVISILLALVFASCKDNPPTTPDATPDAPPAAACTGKLYDACNPASSNCMTGLTCKTFTGSVFSVCTQTCGTCPNQGSSTVMCNAMGICKPNQPNSCTPP